jgi:hypothetical protein
MRVIDETIRTYQAAPSIGVVVQPSQLIPNYGPLFGLWFDLTLTLAGGTHSETSQTIDNIIQTWEIDDQFGKAVVANALGTDITILNDLLTPHGVRQAPPAITTDGSGDGTAEWYLFLPLTVGAADLGGTAQFKLTFNGSASLQNGSLTSAGTVAVNFNVRGGYSIGQDQPTLRIQLTNPAHAQGDNNFQAYLPNGFQMEGLAFILTGGDGDFGYLTFVQGGALFATQAPLHDFTSNDVMLMQSGHLSGEFICRFPVFVVDSTTIFTVNLTTDTAVRIYSIATVPQQRK